MRRNVFFFLFFDFEIKKIYKIFFMAGFGSIVDDGRFIFIWKFRNWVKVNWFWVQLVWFIIFMIIYSLSIHRSDFNSQTIIIYCVRATKKIMFVAWWSLLFFFVRYLQFTCTDCLLLFLYLKKKIKLIINQNVFISNKSQKPYKLPLNH